MCHFPQLKSDFTAFFNEAENEGALFAEGDSGALQVPQLTRNELLCLFCSLVQKGFHLWSSARTNCSPGCLSQCRRWGWEDVGIKLGHSLLRPCWVWGALTREQGNMLNMLHKGDQSLCCQPGSSHKLGICITSPSKFRKQKESKHLHNLHEA